jgi:NADPH:quinone reductase-like Zn-dependent oxidoreductase
VGRAKLQAGAHNTLNPLMTKILNTSCCAGEWLLVLAAAGGVGMAAIQIGKGVLRISSVPLSDHPSLPVASA